jgi:hypothetical protein
LYSRRKVWFAEEEGERKWDGDLMNGNPGKHRVSEFWRKEEGSECHEVGVDVSWNTFMFEEKSWETQEDEDTKGEIDHNE